MNARTPFARERSVEPTGTLPKPRVVPQSTGLASGEPERYLTTDQHQSASVSHAAGSAPSNGSGDQLAKLDALITAAYTARNAARDGDLFVSREGIALVNAAHDLFEVDALYDFAADLQHQRDAA